MDHLLVGDFYTLYPEFGIGVSFPTSLVLEPRRDLVPYELYTLVSV